MKKLLYSFLFLIMFIPSSVFATNEVNVFFFHSNNCDFCNQEKAYLEALKERYPNMRIYSYEVSDSHNKELMLQARKLFDDNREGVPFTVIADTPFHGFNQASKGNMQRAVYLASINKYENKLGKEFNISYRDDLQIEVKEYKENSDYTIEERGEGHHPNYNEEKSETTLKKYQASIILIGSGLFLLVIYLILKIKERRDYR